MNDTDTAILSATTRDVCISVSGWIHLRRCEGLNWVTILQPRLSERRKPPLDFPVWRQLSEMLRSLLISRWGDTLIFRDDLLIAVCRSLLWSGSWRQLLSVFVLLGWPGHIEERTVLLCFLKLARHPGYVSPLIDTRVLNVVNRSVGNRWVLNPNISL